MDPHWKEKRERDRAEEEKQQQQREKDERGHEHERGQHEKAARQQERRREETRRRQSEKGESRTRASERERARERGGVAGPVRSGAATPLPPLTTSARSATRSRALETLSESRALTSPLPSPPPSLLPRRQSCAPRGRIAANRIIRCDWLSEHLNSGGFIGSRENVVSVAARVRPRESTRGLPLLSSPNHRPPRPGLDPC